MTEQKEGAGDRALCVSQRIARLIDQNWETRKEAAKDLGISPQYLTDICNGRRLLSVSVAVALGEYLDRSMLTWDLLKCQLREDYDKKLSETERMRKDAKR